MTSTTQTLLSRVVYLSPDWLYVIHETDTHVYGVRFENTNTNDAHPRFETVARADLTYAGTNHPLSIVDWWPDMVAAFLGGAPAPATSGEAPAPTPDASDAVATAVAEAEERHRAWVDRLVSDAHEFADENSLCSEFDRFMREHGLPERVCEHEIGYTVTYTLTYSGTARVEASNYDDAHDLFHECEEDYVPSAEDLVRHYGVTPEVDVTCD